MALDSSEKNWTTFKQEKYYIFISHLIAMWFCIKFFGVLKSKSQHWGGLKVYFNKILIHLPVRRVNKILNEGFWWTSCWPLVPPPADTLLLMFILFVSTVALFAAVLALALDALLLFSVSISTLKRTFRDKNLSGDRYSQRNKLGLFMLCMRSWVYKGPIF